MRTLLAICTVVAVEAADKPVIAIYPTRTVDGYLDAYKAWLSQAGAAYVQLPEVLDAEQLEEAFQATNGLLIPGGDVPFGTTVQALVERALEANRQGDYYPVWGTCLGFEWLAEIFGGEEVLCKGCFNSEHQPQNLDFTDLRASSRTFAEANSTLVAWFADEAIAYNVHTWGVTPETFAQSPGLSGTFNILATSLDRDGKSFVAEYEGKSLPIYGVQYHPEKIEFDSDTNLSIPRSPHAVAGSRYLANYFVSEARKNKHSEFERLAPALV